jgi:hypothetical protein
MAPPLGGTSRLTCTSRTLEERAQADLYRATNDDLFVVEVVAFGA